MIRLNQLCLILGSFAWLAQSHECSGNRPPSELMFGSLASYIFNKLTISDRM